MIGASQNVAAKIVVAVIKEGWLVQDSVLDLQKYAQQAQLKAFAVGIKKQALRSAAPRKTVFDCLLQCQIVLRSASAHHDASTNHRSYQ